MLQPLSLTTFPLFYVYFIFYGSWKITTYWLGKEKQLLEIDPVKSEANIDRVKSITALWWQAVVVDSRELAAFSDHCWYNTNYQVRLGLWMNYLFYQDCRQWKSLVFGQKEKSFK